MTPPPPDSNFTNFSSFMGSYGATGPSTNTSNSSSQVNPNNDSVSPTDKVLPPLKTTNNNMNSKINKRLDRVPENLGPNGTTPSGKPRLFVCTTCTRAFARHEHLKRHERSHTKEKPFNCGVCQRKFSRRDLLLRHAQKLHAGCDDAIKRLRRRSSRSKSITNEEDSPESPPFSSRKNSESVLSNGLKKVKLDNETGEPRLVGETYNFYLSSNNDLANANRSINSVDFKGRRTSFSAASGANYAGVTRQPNYSDSVEFSTPQLLPVEIQQNQQHLNNNWISDINNIPGLDFLGNFSLNNNNSNGDNNASHHEGNKNHNMPEQMAQTDSSNLLGSNPTSLRRNSKPTEDRRDIFGYSFYDDDYQLSNQEAEGYHNLKFSYPKLPSSYLNDNNSLGSSEGDNSNTGNSSINLNNLNEYELLSELEVPNHEEKILSVGYSFYESNDFASSSVGPNVLGYNKNLKRTSSFMDIDEKEELEFPQNHDESLYYSNLELFTSGLNSKISKVLKEYPFVGLPPPDLPTLQKLNEFVFNFQEKFAYHYPFIHKNYLNEKAMFEYTRNNENPKDYTSFVCLPLLIAAIGALYSKDKKSAADLYEISRRCIHVYLDSRKKSDDAEKSTTHNSPLWLVQSLVLSVLYGLFAEYDESDLGIILRQVNALCTLIKVSKFNLVKFSHENIEINDDYFNDYILYQSKIRTVFMIFNVSSILTCAYNLSPFIKCKELKCDLPDLESYWNCSNVNEFKGACAESSSINYSLSIYKILDDMLSNNPINYKVSEFGSNILMFTVLQYFYFNKTTISNYSVGISPYHSNSSNVVKNYKWEDLLVSPDSGLSVESIILKNISVIRSLQIDLSKVKELMWTRQWQKLSIEFVNLHAKDDDLLDACDYSVRTLSLIFINDTSSSNFKKTISLTYQFLFFNFFYIAKFLYKFERKILRHTSRQQTLNKSDLKEIPKNFSIYLKLAKFLADLEQISIKNFGYNDVESKLALKTFDESRYTFGKPPRLLESEYPKEVNFEQVLKVVKLRLSSNILKIGEFYFNLIYEDEISFNIFKSLSDGLFNLRVHLESEP